LLSFCYYKNRLHYTIIDQCLNLETIKFYLYKIYIFYYLMHPNRMHTIFVSITIITKKSLILITVKSKLIILWLYFNICLPTCKLGVTPKDRLNISSNTDDIISRILKTSVSIYFYTYSWIQHWRILRYWNGAVAQSINTNKQRFTLVSI